LSLALSENLSSHVTHSGEILVRRRTRLKLTEWRTETEGMSCVQHFLRS